MTWRWLGITTWILAITCPAWAATPVEPYTPLSAPTPTNPLDLLLRLVGLTLVTLIVAGGGILWARRLGQGHSADNPNGRIIHLGTLSLDRCSTIHQIQVDGQHVMVAIDGSGLRSLTVIAAGFDAVLAEEVNATNTV